MNEKTIDEQLKDLKEAMEEMIKERDKAVSDMKEAIKERDMIVSRLMQLLESNSRASSNASFTLLDFPNLDAANPRLQIRTPSIDEELKFPPPTTQELSQALIELQGQNVKVEGSYNPIFTSSKAHYYTTSIIPIGVVTLKVCLDSDVQEKDSYKRSKDMIELHNAITIVVQPILSFQFRVKFHCYIFDHFKLFNLGVKMGPMLAPAQLDILKDIFRCLGFLIDKGGHGRVDHSSVCGLVLCHGRAMVTDLMPKPWGSETSTPNDYKACGSVIENHARTLFNQNLPQNLKFLIDQLKKVSFNDRLCYNCFDKHPIFYSDMKRLLYFMFGSTETEVTVALNAKENAGKLKGQTKTGLTYEELFGNCRLTERAKVECNLQKHLDLIGSCPAVVSPSPSGSPAGSGSCVGSPSTSVSRFYWANVYRGNSEIEAVWDWGDKRKVKYDYSAPLDFMRFVRNVYAHIHSPSLLNGNQREGLFREVNKMWPGYIYALFLTLSEMGTDLDG